MRPHIAIAPHTILRFQSLQQLLNGGVLRRRILGIKLLGQLAHGGPAAVPQDLQNSELGVGDILRWSWHADYLFRQSLSVSMIKTVCLTCKNGQREMVSGAGSAA